MMSEARVHVAHLWWRRRSKPRETAVNLSGKRTCTGRISGENSSEEGSPTEQLPPHQDDTYCIWR